MTRRSASLASRRLLTDRGGTPRFSRRRRVQRRARVASRPSSRRTRARLGAGEHDRRCTRAATATTARADFGGGAARDDAGVPFPPRRIPARDGARLTASARAVVAARRGPRDPAAERGDARRRDRRGVRTTLRPVLRGEGADVGGGPGGGRSASRARTARRPTRRATTRRDGSACAEERARGGADRSARPTAYVSPRPGLLLVVGPPAAKAPRSSASASPRSRPTCSTSRVVDAPASRSRSTSSSRDGRRDEFASRRERGDGTATTRTTRTTTRNRTRTIATTTSLVSGRRGIARQHVDADVAWYLRSSSARCGAKATARRRRATRTNRVFTARARGWRDPYVSRASSRT